MNDYLDMNTCVVDKLTDNLLDIILDIIVQFAIMKKKMILSSGFWKKLLFSNKIHA